MESYDPGPTQQRQPMPQKAPLSLLSAMLFLLIFLMMGYLWLGIRPSWGPLLDPVAMPRPITPRGDLAEDEKMTIDLFSRSSKSVVFVTTGELRQDYNFNVMEISKGSGTGFVWDLKGHIVTNYHVVEGANRWHVRLADQSTWDAQLVGAAPDRDLAVLKILAPAKKLQPVPIGESNNLQVGQKVFAIGNPFGLDQTLTTGVISGLGREIKSRSGATIQGVVQTDAAINPGNSGGPLLDSAGHLIGVNTAIYSPSGASAGIGFAIPADSVNRVVPMILRRGNIVRPVLGIRVAPDQVMQRLGVKGVMIIDFPQSSPAAQAGLQPLRIDKAGNEILGDVIVRIDGKSVDKLEDLLSVLGEYKPGDTVQVTALRNAKTNKQQEVVVSVRLVGAE